MGKLSSLWNRLTWRYRKQKDLRGKDSHSAVVGTTLYWQLRDGLGWHIEPRSQFMSHGNTVVKMRKPGA